MKSETLTIMFIDIAGYTRTTARLDRAELDNLHEAFDNIVHPVFNRFHGNVVKKIGDAFLITFKSATDAVWCGIELQKAFSEYNKKKNRAPLNIRVVLHTGEVIHRKNDIYGDAVNTAARIESISSSGEIIFSESVFLAMNKSEVPFVYLGARKLKGLKYPIKLFRVKGMYDDIIRFKKKVKRRVMNVFSALFWLLLIAGIILLLIYAYYNYQNLLRLL